MAKGSIVMRIFVYGLTLIGFAFFAKAAEPVPPATAAFTLTSPVVKEGAALPVEFSGNGEGVSPPLVWQGAPAGTKSYVLIMHHFPHEGEAARYYWILYNLPATVTTLARASKGVGLAGGNSVGQPPVGYTPPHSKGPGVKKYTITVYALSAIPQPAATGRQLNRDLMLAAIKDSTLTSAELNFTFDSGGAAEKGSEKPPEKGGKKAKRPPAEAPPK